jgi:hypothetical protein
MSVKAIFASFALIAAVTASVFGVCTVQHSGLQAHSMEKDTMLVGAMGDGSCPLSNVADFGLSEKYSQADPWVFWRVVAPTGFGHLVSLKIVPTEFKVDTTVDQNHSSRSDIPISITSPPLAYAYSQGILNPKLFSIA